MLRDLSVQGLGLGFLISVAARPQEGYSRGSASRVAKEIETWGSGCFFNPKPGNPLGGRV